jgi:hypothetical protein
MSELEIRAAIRKLCTELDLRARSIACGAVIPLVIGASIAVTDCSKKEETQPTAGAGGAAQPLYAAPGGGGIGGAGGAVGGAMPAYMAPGGGGAGGMDGGAAPEYMAPGGGGAGGI